jgi:hypothetical protein
LVCPYNIFHHVQASLCEIPIWKMPLRWWTEIRQKFPVKNVLRWVQSIPFLTFLRNAEFEGRVWPSWFVDSDHSTDKFQLKVETTVISLFSENSYFWHESAPHFFASFGGRVQFISSYSPTICDLLDLGSITLIH